MKDDQGWLWDIGFRFAVAGILHTLKTQKNTWVHAFFTLAVMVVGPWLRLGIIDWAVLVGIIGLVWSAELLNTAIEAIVDLVSPEQHSLAKIAKDASAGAVLISSFCAVIVGLLIMGPPLIERILLLGR